MKATHEKIEVKLFTGKDPHIVTYTLPEILDKYSPWLRVVHTESHGPVNNVMNILMKTGYKKNSLVTSGDSYWIMAHNAIPPYKKPYTHYAVAQQFTSPFGLITLDQNIKSWSDLRGKRVNMYLPGSIVNEIFTIVLKFHGIYDQVDKVYVGYWDAKDGLLDGSIDATENALYKCPNAILPHETMAELISKRPDDLHFISFTREELEEIAKKAFFPVLATKIKAAEVQKNLQLKRQEEDFLWTAVFHFLGCDGEMDSEVTYEICRVLAEHMNEYAIKYHAPALGWTLEKLAKEAVYPLGGLANCGVKREFFHPGALKYYEERGIKVVEPPSLGKVAWLE